MIRWQAVVGCFIGLALLVQAADDAGAWRRLEQAGVQAGLDPARASAAVGLCVKAGLTPAAAEPVLAPVYDAARGKLPADLVLDKVEEGFAKQAAPEQVAAAAGQRRDCLRQASDLVARYGTSSDLVAPAALALESGMPAGLLDGVLAQGRQRAPEQVTAVIAAGETLNMNGFAPEAAGALMQDCLQRNLRRPDILRATRFAVQQRRRGMTDGQVRNTLWGEGRVRAAGQSDGNGGGGQGMQRRGPGDGSGPGGAAGGGGRGGGQGPGRQGAY